MAHLGTTQAQLGNPALGLWVINNLHNVIVQALMGAIVTVWR